MAEARLVVEVHVPQRRLLRLTLHHEACDHRIAQARIRMRLASTRAHMLDPSFKDSSLAPCGAANAPAITPNYATTTPRTVFVRVPAYLLLSSLCLQGSRGQ